MGAQYKNLDREFYLQQLLAGRIQEYWHRQGHTSVLVRVEKRSFITGGAEHFCCEIVSNLINGRPVSA